MSERAEAELLVPDNTADFISQGRSDNGFQRPAITQRACCCASRPLVQALLPNPNDLTDHVDVMLCGHHYRVSIESLARLGASVDYVGDVEPWL